MVLLMLAALMLPAPAARADGGWNADLVAQSAQTVVLESGETTTTWFEFKNINQNGRPWERRDDAVGPVRLGTQNAQDRLSDFRHDSWLQSNRPTRLDQEAVPLNAVGRFTFIAQAPSGPAGDAVRGDVRAGRRDPVLDARRVRDDHLHRPPEGPARAGDRERARRARRSARR